MTAVSAPVIRALACLVGLVGATPLQAADNAGAQETGTVSRFFDPEDGWFDVSGFLDTAHGFVPVIAPITEPAVGYGAVGALVFVDRDTSGQGERYTRPNIAVVGGLGTENGTRGLFAGHLGTWMDGRLRTLVAAADVDVNLSSSVSAANEPLAMRVSATRLRRGGASPAGVTASAKPHGG